MKKDCGIKIGKGGSRTPVSVMGSQGISSSIPLQPRHNKSKSTGHTTFPGGTKSPKAAKGKFNHAK